MRILPNIKYYDLWKFTGQKWIMIDWDLTKQKAEEILFRINRYNRFLYNIQESTPSEDFRYNK